MHFSFIEVLKRISVFSLAAVAGLTYPAAAQSDPEGELPDGLSYVSTRYTGVDMVVATEAFYSQFKYKWIDAKGVEHESCITERAEDREQIIALLKEIYTNRMIPGYKRDIAFNRFPDAEYLTETGSAKLFTTEYERDNDGNVILNSSGNPVRATATYTTPRADSQNVKYTGCEINPYNIPLKDDDGNEIDYAPYYEGATALLIELTDDYDRSIQGVNPGESICGYDNKINDYTGLNFIKAVTLITNQIYVSENEGSTNPGYLFAVEANLAKCFIVTKGSIRPYKSFPRLAGGSSVTDKIINEGFPFYNMFEEFSPTNEGPMYNAFSQMNSGKRFAVDHNCSSIIEQQHDIVFGPSEQHTRGYQVNLRFYLPDWRFADYTNYIVRKDSEGKEVKSEYVAYSYYAKEYQPYIFFNKIIAEIDANVKYEEGNSKHAWIPVKWNSAYRDIVKNPTAVEEFYIYRVRGGIINPDPIPFNEVRLRDGITTTSIVENEDGSYRFINGSDENSYIEVLENVENTTDPTYIVYGRRADSQFALVESNIVETDLMDSDTHLHLNLRKAYARNGFSHPATNAGVQANVNNYANILDVIYNPSGQNQLIIGDLNWNWETETGDRAAWPYFPTSKLYIDRIATDSYNNESGESTTIASISVEDPQKDIYTYDWKGATRTESGQTYVYVYRLTIRSLVDNSVMGYMFYKVNNSVVRAYKTDGTGATFNFLACIDAPQNNPYNNNFDNTTEHQQFLNFSNQPLEKIVVGTGNNAYIQFPDKGYYKFTYDTNGTETKREVVVSSEKLGEFKDVFKESTESGNHPDSYMYQMYLPKKSGDILNSNKSVVILPKRPLIVGYMPYTREQVMADCDFHGERLSENPHGIAFEIKNNANIEGYSIYHKPTNKIIARAERLSSGAFESYYLNKDGKEVMHKRTAERYQGYLPIPVTFDQIEDDDDFTIDIRYIGQDKADNINPYNIDNSGNSYGGRLIKIMSRPEPVITDVQIKKIGQNNSNKYDYTCTITIKTKNLSSNLIDESVNFESENDQAEYLDHRTYKVGGYGIWSHVHANYTVGDGFYPENAQFNSVHHFEEQSEEVTLNAIMPLAEDDDNDIDDTTLIKTYNFEHERNASRATPIAVTHAVRLYAEIPQEGLIADNAGRNTEGYMVLDTDALHGIIGNSGTTTGVEDVLDDFTSESAHYYNLNGLEVSAEHLTPGIYIVRQGEITSKVLIK